MAARTARGFARIFLAAAYALPLLSASADERTAAATHYALTLNEDEFERASTFFNTLHYLSLSGSDIDDLAEPNFAPPNLVRSFFPLDARFRASMQLAFARAEPFIWNGEDASADQFLETTLVLGIDGICSGVLVSNRLVLTAAHCWCNDTLVKVKFGQTRDAFMAERRIVDTHPFPLTCDTRRGRDLALLEIDQTVSFRPALIASHDTAAALQLAVLVGFGRAESPDRPSGVKRYAEVPVTSTRCEGQTPNAAGALEPDSKVFGCVPGRELVAGSPAWQIDTCKGDSGGPVYTELGESRALVAITSRPTDNSLSLCGDGGIYTLLDGDVLTWLSGFGIKIN